jgi:hypothetical protein
MQESDKHAARIDEQLEHETAHLTSGSPTENRDEFRRQQAPGDGEPETGMGDRPELDEAPGLGLAEHDAEERSQLAIHLGRVFPATRDRLLTAAEENMAPPDVLQRLRTLPAGESYETVEAVWEALGGEGEGAHTGLRQDAGG